MLIILADSELIITVSLISSLTLVSHLVTETLYVTFIRNDMPVLLAFGQTGPFHNGSSLQLLLSLNLSNQTAINIGWILV